MKVQTATQVTTAGNAPQNSSALPISGTFALWQMLATMMKYLRNILQNNAELQKMWATSLGGKDGIYARMFNLGIEAGKDQAASIRDEAFGNIAQACVSGATVIGTGSMYAFKTNPEVNAEESAIKDLETQKAALTGAAPGKQPNAGIQIADEEENLDPNAQERLAGLADGSVPVANLNNRAEEELNDQVVAHAANEPDKQENIIKRLDEQKQEHQKNIDRARQSFTTVTNQAEMFSGALGSGAVGAAKLFQADDTAKAAQDSSAKDVVSQVQQQITAQEQRAEQNAQDALSQAGSWAQAFASAASAQVHA